MEMKKIIIIVLLIFVSSIIVAVHKLMDLPNPIGYFGWQSVSMAGTVTFKVPQDWIVTYGEKVIFITDRPMEEEGYKIYFAGVIEESDPYDYEVVSITEHDKYTTVAYGIKNKEEIDGKWLYYYSGHDFFKDVQYIESVKSAVFSNSAYYGIKKYKIDGNIEEKYYLEFSIGDGSDVSIELLSWDNLINEKTIIKIAKSYRYW